MSESPYKYLMPEIPEPEIDLKKTALMIIDMQYLDAHPDYGWGKKLKDQGVAHLGVPFFERVQTTVVPNLRELLRACRAAGVEVVFVKIEMQKSDLRDAGRPYRLTHFYSPKGSKEAEILAEIAPLPDEVVLSKTTTGVFNSTNADHVLRSLGVEYLIVTGVNTNACVQLATLDAADRGYWIFLVEDACAAIGGEEAHRDAIARLGRGVVKIKQTSDIIAKINALAAQPARSR